MLIINVILLCILDDIVGILLCNFMLLVNMVYIFHSHKCNSYCIVCTHVIFLALSECTKHVLFSNEDTFIS